MQEVNVFIQGPCLPDIEVVTADLGDSLNQVVDKLSRSDLEKDGQLIFVEDFPCPVARESIVEELIPLCPIEATPAPLRLHVTCCGAVKVEVRYNGVARHRVFPPSATIERVRRWAARRAFCFSPRDAADHVLKLQGDSKRPDRDLHVGVLVKAAGCSVSFDLVPHQRVEG